MLRKTLIAGLFFVSVAAMAVERPDPQMSPGELCSAQDAHFKGYDYPEQIARCNRNVNTSDKRLIASRYGNIPQSEWSHYEFDHVLPLCVGGSNDMRNLWPQPKGEADDKDKLESTICRQMKAGTLTQAKAVAQVRDWFANRKAPIRKDDVSPGQQQAN